jgi:CheY-like chemotaxis protein
VDSRRPEVLIVEDEPLVALNLEALVEDLGYVVAASLPDAKSAWERASKSVPDVAIVDLNLLDGKTGLKLATRLGVELDVVVIVATGNPADVIGTEPIFEVVRKPYLDETIAQALDRALLARGARNNRSMIRSQVANGA